MNNQLFHLKFNKDKLVHEFSLPDEDYFIVFKKVAFDSFIGQNPNVWSSKVTRLNPQLKVSFNHPNRCIKEAPISINGYISPSQHYPVVELEKKYPSNDFEISRQNNYFSCKVEIEYTPQDDTELDMSVSCEASAGLTPFE